MPVLEPLGDEDSWAAYRRLILSDLRSLRDRDTQIQDKLEKIIRAQEALRIDIAGLQVKSGVWGAIAGLIPVVVAMFMLLVGRAWR